MLTLPQPEVGMLLQGVSTDWESVALHSIPASAIWSYTSHFPSLYCGSPRLPSLFSLQSLGRHGLAPTVCMYCA